MPSVADGSFDAVVGRRVLMYQPDAKGALWMLSRVLRPGGLIIFQEHDATVGPVSLTLLPLQARVREWIWRTVQRELSSLRLRQTTAVMPTQGRQAAGLR